MIAEARASLRCTSLTGMNAKRAGLPAWRTFWIRARVATDQLQGSLLALKRYAAILCEALRTRFNDGWGCLQRQESLLRAAITAMGRRPFRYSANCTGGDVPARAYRYI
ncbi:hypothetical protein KCP70_01305 [Salmonella enterica subsp. enterica]|nr:hypothetical protein KCP70_01305 [Salmonella enterica subsp. enterica]